MIISTKELALIIGTLTFEPSLAIEPVELACLARNIYHEARSEGRDGMVAVGYVTRRRLKTGRWGDTWCDVVEAPHQFSWHSDGKPDAPADMTAYRRALAAAVDVVLGRVPDASKRATHYYAHALVRPAWADAMPTTTVIGGHVFKTTLPITPAPDRAPVPPRRKL